MKKEQREYSNIHIRSNATFCGSVLIPEKVYYNIRLTFQRNSPFALAKRETQREKKRERKEHTLWFFLDAFYGFAVSQKPSQNCREELCCAALVRPSSYPMLR